jgi:endonuclease YncB( thermonuclease family)
MKKIFAGAIAILASILVIAAIIILVFTGEGPEVPETPTSEAPYHEMVASVVWVDDGDTIDVKVIELTAELDPKGEIYEDTIERIRFGGGIDAPETWSTPPEEGGHEATEFIENLLPTWTTVYLDIDNLAGSQDNPYRDAHGRLIAVIYVKKDGKWINVNAELLCWGMEAYPNNDWDQYTYISSEFSVYDWPPYDNDYPYFSGFVERRDVLILIRPDENAGAPGESVTFTVFIKNVGNVEATYSLTAGDNTGWNLMLADDLIEHLAPGHVQETTLTITIPEGAENCTRDNVTVTVTSQENTEVENSDSCIAHCLVSIT